jgi:hypothetical protein
VLFLVVTQEGLFVEKAPREPRENQQPFWNKAPREPRENQFIQNDLSY